MGRPALFVCIRVYIQNRHSRRKAGGEKEGVWQKKKGSTTEIVRALAEPLAKELGLIIWGRYVHERGRGLVSAHFIDKEGGVGIDDCVDLTRAINPVLDSEDPIPQEYTLRSPRPASTASSPARSTLRLFLKRRCA